MCTQSEDSKGVLEPANSPHERRLMRCGAIRLNHETRGGHHGLHGLHATPRVRHGARVLLPLLLPLHWAGATPHVGHGVTLLLLLHVLLLLLLPPHEPGALPGGVSWDG